MSNARYRNLKPAAPSIGDLAVARMFSEPVKPRGRWRLLLPALGVMVVWLAVGAAVLLLAALLSGCSFNAQLVDACDKYDQAVSPEYLDYVNKDAALTPEEKARRRASVDDFRNAIRTVKGK